MLISSDVKPENCLIDSNGHIKLADFGSCIRLDETSTVTSHETVGTPDYISPEILRALEGQANYGISVDWWSLGIILFELMYDEVPFYSESLVETYGKIMDHEKHFAFPEDEDVELTDTCRDLIQKLICKKEVRLGESGADELKKHSWFKDINWDTLRETNPPFVPELSGPEDTRYFEDEDDESKKFTKKALAKNKDYNGRNLPFVGYTYLTNAVAQISFTNDASEEGVTADSDTKSMESFSAQQSLKQQLLQETQKYNTTLTAKKQLEEEIASLKVVMARESSQRSELQAQVSLTEKEKIRLETEIRQAKLSLDRAGHERTMLEEKVQQLKSSFDREVQSKAESQELSEIRKKLEKEIAAINAALVTEKKENAKRALSVAELSKVKNLQEKELEKLVKSEKAYEILAKEASQKLSSLESQLDVEMARSKEFANKSERYEQELSKLTAEHQNTAHQAQLDNEKASKLIQRTTEIEKEKAVLQIELQTNQQKLSEAAQKIEDLEKVIVDLQTSRIETIDSENVNLRQQLSQQIALRNKVSNELSELSKAKAVLELEQIELKKKLEDQTKFGSEKLEQIAKLKQEGTEAQQRIEGYIEKLERSESRAEQLSQDVSCFKSLNDEKTAAMLKLEAEASNLRESNAETSVELQNLKSKAESDQAQLQTLEAKLLDLEELHSTELKSRINFELLYKSLQQSHSQLHQELERLENRISLITKEHEKSINEHQVTVTDLRSQIDSVEEKLRIDKQERYELEDAKLQFGRKLQEVEAELDFEIQMRKQTDSMLQTAEKRVDELNVKLEQSNATQKSIQDQLFDVEHERDVYRSKVEHFEEREREAQNEAKLKSDDKSASRFRLRGLFFKPVGISTSRDLTELSDRSAQKLNDIDDLLSESTRDVDHARKHSFQSLESFASTQKTSALSPALSSSLSVNLFEYYNPLETLEGWLKVPKGGKVKKGWKIQYAVVRDFKMFIYENDRDVQNAKSMSFIDIRYIL